MGIGNGMRGVGLAGIGLLAGCVQSTPTALGTLEWDRITVPAPAAEVIATVEVREGQQVKAGAVLMQLDPARGDAQFAAAQADTVRAQEIAQVQAAADAAQAQQVVQGVNLQKLQLRAPRDGVVDALPYRQGDQAPIGAPLAVMLVGERPYARVYLPQPLRLQVKVGQAAQIQLEGGSAVLKGHVRAIRSEPSFTPYYALTGDDVERLSYLAEIEVDAPSDMQKLPAGMPVQVSF